MIKRHYINPPLIECDTYFNSAEERRMTGISGQSYEVSVYIWVSQMMPEYRVLVPSKRVFDGNGKDIPWAPIEMRYITYKPTGRVVYDNTDPEPKGIVYEYVLEKMFGKNNLMKVIK
jgi:hypothetical protein